MNHEDRPAIDMFRKLNLIDALINSDDEDPRAQHLGSRVLLFRDFNCFGCVETRDDELWLTFYDTATPCRVTNESVPQIVSVIENHRR